VSRINDTVVPNVANASDVPESFLSSQSHEPFKSESTQNHLKFCRVESS